MRVRSLLTDDEFASIIGRVRTELVDDLSSTISNWRDTYTYDENKDPEDYFDPLRESLRRFQDELDGDADAVASLSKAIESIDAVVEELRESTPGEQEDYDYDGSSLPSRRDPSRSIFDDIDQ